MNGLSRKWPGGRCSSSLSSPSDSENIIDEMRRIFTIAQDMTRRPHLPDVGIGIERGKDGCEGDRYIEQEEGSDIVWFGRI